MGIEDNIIDKKGATHSDTVDTAASKIDKRIFDGHKHCDTKIVKDMLNGPSIKVCLKCGEQC